MVVGVLVSSWFAVAVMVLAICRAAACGDMISVVR
jgi:hypothetical protein